jgi:hypothetical protein
MKLSLNDAIVGITGKVKGYTKSALSECVSKWGGRLENRSDPSPGMTLYFVGDNGSPRGKVDHARVYGAALVSGDDILTLLEEGEVEVNKEEDRKTFDEIVGPVRALLAEPLTRKTWLSLTEHVDECKAEEMDKLLAYMQPQLDARTAQYEQNPRVYDFESGELRPFPPAWLAEIMNGEVHEKYNLCQTVTYSEFYVGSKIATRVFDHHEAFAHITRFDTGDVMDSNMKTRPFYKKMCTATNVERVHTLVLESDKKDALGELLKATSLPHVTSLYLRPTLSYRTKGLNLGADLYFGPWAEQLITVGASHARHVEVLTERINELPAFEHLALYTGEVREHEDMSPFLSAVPAIIPHIKRLSICASRLNGYNFGSYGSLEGLGELLDAISERNLGVLDLRSCMGTVLKGEIGEAFIQKHFIDNGFVGHLGQLVVNEHISLELCDMLRAHGVDVVAPAKVEVKALAPTFDYIDKVPAGELERHANHQVHVHDAMMFTRPCEEAWQVLIGVVNGLERQCTADDFADAIKTLNAHLEQWPDDLRVLPTAWFKALFDEVPSPKLDLIRVLNVKLGYGGITSDAKCASRWFEHLSRAPHIARIPKLSIGGFEGQKHQQKALLTLMKSMKPERISPWLGKKKDEFLALLKEHDVVLPELSEFFSSRSIHYPRFKLTDAYANRHVSHEVTTPEELQEVFALQDLNHVVSLDLKVDHYDFEKDPDCSFLKASPADFKSLKYLKISLRKYDKDLCRELVTWLKHARPVVFEHYTTELVPELIDAGLYGRAFGSSVKWHSHMSSDELERCVSAPHFHVSRIWFEFYRGYSLDGIPELVEAMHDGLRECVRELSWPTELSEWSEVGSACARLPNLSTLAAAEPAFATDTARAPFLKAFETMTHLHGLPIVKLLNPVMSDPQPFTAKEIKPLKKLKGSPSDVLCLCRS